MPISVRKITKDEEHFTLSLKQKLIRAGRSLTALSLKELIRINYSLIHFNKWCSEPMTTLK